MQPLHQKRHKCSHSTTALLLLLSFLVATVASVPTSVLAQNSEVTSNIMSLNANKQNHQANTVNNNGNTNNSNNNKDNVMMSKVKRSSNNADDSSTNNLSSSGLEKKSSPEVLPPSFNIPVPSSNQHDLQEELQQQQQLQQLQHQQPQQAQSSQPATNTVYALPTNSEILAAVEAAAAAAAVNQRELEQKQGQFYGNMDEVYDNQAGDYPIQPQKRGIINPPQYMYDGLSAPYSNVNPVSLYGTNPNTDFYNPYLTGPSSAAMVPVNDANLVGVPNGYWSDDDGVIYTDVPEANEFAPMPRSAANYRSKAYDNLQNILNSEAYLESAAAAAAAPIPVQYAANRYYANLDADHNKRNKFGNRYGDYRLKRDTKLTPADMLALVALVEAGERARQDNEDESRYQQYNELNKQNPYEYYVPTGEDAYEYEGYGGANNNPIDYYPMPINAESIPKYENINKYGSNAYDQKYENTGSKRFMVAKRKRSMGKFYNEPIGKPSVGYNGDKYF